MIYIPGRVIGCARQCHSHDVVIWVHHDVNFTPFSQNHINVAVRYLIEYISRLVVELFGSCGIHHDHVILIIIFSGCKGLSSAQLGMQYLRCCKNFWSPWRKLVYMWREVASTFLSPRSFPCMSVSDVFMG